MTEFELIDLFTRELPLRGPGVVVGVGDDAAALALPRGELLVATADAVVEGVHFDRRFPPRDVGWKALAVNLSDLAARRNAALLERREEYLRKAELDLARTEVKIPVAGMVSERAAPGMTVKTDGPPLLVIVGDTPRDIEPNSPECRAPIAYVHRPPSRRPLHN